MVSSMSVLFGSLEITSMPCSVRPRLRADVDVDEADVSSAIESPKPESRVVVLATRFCVVVVVVVIPSVFSFLLLSHVFSFFKRF